ncbi:hypothetical protein IJL65_00945 [bacterium]|nr:hypothetical protein [bacterium]
MKRTLFMLLAIGMMATTAVNATAQESGSTISFTNEIGCGIEYTLPVLVDILSSCDTLYECDEADRLIAEYDKEFPSSGPDEPAVLILVPDDEYFNVIFIQEDPDGEILTLRILTDEGWLECDSEPYSRELIDLASFLSFVQHLLEVTDSPCLH